MTLESLHAIDVRAAMGGTPVVLLPLLVNAAKLANPGRQGAKFVRSCLEMFGVEVTADQFYQAQENLSNIILSLMQIAKAPGELDGPFGAQLLRNSVPVGKSVIILVPQSTYV